jgi:DNA-binding GntR family transcriptional regulator
MSSGTRRNLADRTQFETLVDRDLDAAQRAMIAHIQNVHRSTLALMDELRGAGA